MKSAMQAPLCFVLLPFGRKTLSSGVTVDFDAAYTDTIAPAITAAGLDPIRADQDSPAFRFFQGLPPSELSRLSTDVFRDGIPSAKGARQALEAARRTNDPARVRDAAAALGPVGTLDAGTLVDLLLSHRAVKDHQAMVDLVAQLPEPIARLKLVQEQLGFALNRLERRDEAETVLQNVIASHGPSGESNGLLGRLYKDRWDAAVKAGDFAAAHRWLDKAIATYLQGFEADWRDAYPGINAVTLMEFTTLPDPRRLELLPVVTYAVRRRIAAGAPDYWDHATLLELAVLREDAAAADTHLADALAAVRETWEPETTARSLGLIRESRAARGVVHGWADAAEAALRQRASA
jgi:tetratricopeptide (TPR) repeat protein